uniref:Periplasmic heavy metal sensor n=1 Tax=Hydrogenovibrio crunogenus (strain DSM 25203 / XCL-2) TaxID=317025 RepID=Q31H38_HYDCU
MYFLKTPLRQTLTAIAFVTGVSVMSQVQAEPTAPAPHSGGMQQMPKMTPEQQSMMMELQKTQQQLQQTQQELQKIQQQVYKESPELQKQRDALQAKVSEKMSHGGYDADKELKKMNALVDKYQNSEEKPSQSEIQEFQASQKEFQARQQKVFQDPEVRKMAENLQQNVKAKIEATGPKGKSLIVRLENQMKKLQDLRQKAMAMMRSQ